MMIFSLYLDSMKIEQLKSDADKNSINTIVDLLKALYLELGEEANSVNYLNEQLIIDLIKSGKTEIFLAKESKKIIGILTLTESQSAYAGGNYGSIDEMYILPKYRSKGIGKLMIEKIIAIAKEKNWKRIDLTTPTDSEWDRTILFYQSCGFSYTGQKMKMRF